MESNLLGLNPNSNTYHVTLHYLIIPWLSFLSHKIRKITELNSKTYKGLHIKPIKFSLAHSNHSTSIQFIHATGSCNSIYQNSTVGYSCYWTLHFGSLVNLWMIRFSDYFRKSLFLHLIYILLCWDSHHSWLFKTIIHPLRPQIQPTRMKNI